MGVNYPLCRICKQLTFDDVAGDAVANTAGSEWALADTWPGLPGLRESAAAGCTFCECMVFILTEGKIPGATTSLARAKPGSRIRVALDDPAYVTRSSIVELVPGWEHVSRREEPDGICWLQLRVSCEGFDREWRSRVWVYRGAGAVSQHLGIEMRKPALHGLDPGFINLVREWVHDCESNHAQCRPHASPVLPTRLIDIGTGSSGSPRLVDGISVPPSSRYFALSYCWGPPSGTKPQLITTKTTLAARQSAIPLDTMPQTMQDFIALSRRLGTRYVWIDALCIVQDDAADWEHEASRMFSVYRHASLTIAAAAGPTAHSGFLKRSSGPHAVVPFTSKRQGADVRGEYLLYHLNERRLWDADNPAHLHGAAWATRAWAMQEDLLSTRVLYFGAETAFFRCQGARRAENCAAGYEPMRRWHETLSRSSAANAQGEETEKERERLYEMWDLLVAEYSERKLTMDKDKLPALSGLAQSFTAALGDEYVAGMWRGDLLHGLLWYIFHDSREASGWRAPSWSWAARDGCVAVVAHSRPVAPRATVEEVRVVPRGRDPFGMLSDGWVVLRGPVRPVVLRPTVTRHSDNTQYMDVRDRESGELVGYGTMDSVTHSGLKNDGTFRAADITGLEALTDVWALQLCLTPTFDFAEDEETVVVSEPEYPAGILVRPVRGANGGEVYERVGMFRTDETDDLGLWTGLAERRIKVV